MRSTASVAVMIAAVTHQRLLSNTFSQCFNRVHATLVSNTLFDWGKTISGTTSSGSRPMWQGNLRYSNSSTHLIRTARQRTTLAGRRPSSLRRAKEIQHGDSVQREGPANNGCGAAGKNEVSSLGAYRRPIYAGAENRKSRGYTGQT